MKRKHKNVPADRFDYLKSLINEFYVSKQIDAQREVLANLANFAYNPVNFLFFRQLNIIDVFIDALGHDDANLRLFAISGLCNLSADPENKAIIISRGAIPKISEFLSDSNTDLVLHALGTLIYLVAPSSHKSIASEDNIRIVRGLENSTDARVRNLAKIFLQDICTDATNHSAGTSTT